MRWVWESTTPVVSVCSPFREKQEVNLLEILLSRYNDPYLDNALQSFHRMLKEINEQFPDVMESQLSPNCLRIKINKRDEFIDLLENKIEQELDLHLRYSRKKNDETVTEGWKPFLPFLSQPSHQYPQTFKEETRRELLERAFPVEMSQRAGKLCFLCGKFPAPLELTQGIYPFVTKSASLTTATYLAQRSSSRSYYSVCPLCYLIASLGWADPAIPYRSRVSLAPRQTVSFLWLPYESSSLERLDQLKKDLPKRLRLKDEFSNVRLELPYQGYPPSRFSLLLAFLESLLLQVAERKVVSLEEESLNIPDEWWFLRIPEGRGMKNVDMGAFFLSQRIKEVIAKYLQEGKPYGELLGLIWMRQEGEQRDRKEEGRRTDLLREELSRAFLSDDYNSFAHQFQVRPRWIIVLPSGGDEKLFNLIKIWRCKDMLSEQELEVLRRAGRTIALISDLRSKPSVLYNLLDRVRTPSDLLSALREIGHLLVGVDFQEDEAQYLSPDSLDQLVQLVKGKEKLFSDIKNTLGIFVSVEYAKRRLRERRQER